MAQHDNDSNKPDRTDEVTAEEMESENTADVFKRVLTELGFHDYLPSLMTNSDYWLCTTMAMKEYASLRLAEVLSKAGKELPDEKQLQIERTMRPFESPIEDERFDEGANWMKEKALSIIASLKQSNEQKDREMIKAKQLIKELLPLAEDAHKANVRSGVGHQEFIQEDSETISDARKFLAD